MSAEKKYTERDLVLAKRNAFKDGHAFAHAPWGANDYAKRALDKEAERRYPLPKVTRPKEVKDADGDLWSVRDGVLGFRVNYTGSEWCASDHFNSPEILNALRDAITNPTEEVEDA